MVGGWFDRAGSKPALAIAQWSKFETPVAVGDDDDDVLPHRISLGQNYPNPFNPSTVIEFDLPRRSHVTITVFNVLGRKVIDLTDRKYSAGHHQVRWTGQAADGTPVASGVYFYRLQSDDFVTTRQMTLLK